MMMWCGVLSNCLGSDVQNFLFNF